MTVEAPVEKSLIRPQEDSLARLVSAMEEGIRMLPQHPELGGVQTQANSPETTAPGEKENGAIRSTTNKNNTSENSEGVPYDTVPIWKPPEQKE